MISIHKKGQKSGGFLGFSESEIGLDCITIYESLPNDFFETIPPIVEMMNTDKSLSSVDTIEFEIFNKQVISKIFAFNISEKVVILIGKLTNNNYFYYIKNNSHNFYICDTYSNLCKLSSLKTAMNKMSTN